MKVNKENPQFLLANKNVRVTFEEFYEPDFQVIIFAKDPCIYAYKNLLGYF